MPTDGPPPDPRTFESAVERQIREAMERGEFNDLPGSGKPIEDLDGAYDPEWWVKRWVSRERLTEVRRELVELRRRERARRDAGVEAPDDVISGLDARIAAIDARLARPGDPGRR